MRIEGESLDDLLRQSYEMLGGNAVSNSGTRAKIVAEVIGVSLNLKNPRARLSRSSDRGIPLSAVGELLWYLSGTDDPDFITSYIRNYRKEVGSNGRINGAYGPRLFSKFGINQFDAVAKLLERKPNTKRAVMQIYCATDLLTDDEVPCTTTLQFLNRNGKLHAVASLRSNDAYYGLPHDVFCFTMLQEMLAKRLNLELGEYTQMVGSFHLYEGFEEKAAEYLKEGYHRVEEMPEMPDGDPFLLLPDLLEAEAAVRSQAQGEDALVSSLPYYWADVLRLAQAKITKDGERLAQIRETLQNRSYEAYLDDRADFLARLAKKPV